MASFLTQSDIIDGVTLGVRAVAGVECPAVDTGDLGGALKHPDLSKSMEPQTMKNSWHMHIPENDENSLVSELEHLIWPYILLLDENRKQSNCVIPGVDETDEIQKSLISSQKDYLWLNEILRQEHNTQDSTVYKSEATKESHKTLDILEDLSETVENIFRGILEDTLHEQK